MKSQTVLFFIFMFSFFVLHQCIQEVDDVRGGIESGRSKLTIPNCVPAQCGKEGFFKRNCWCCFRDLNICFFTQKACDSSPRCTPLKFTLLEN
ncbi:hypothetical protein CARUB_v10011759mg [Capsella rubella]|uniref:Embryo surrounding factor 1 brassicaceae domain-containing protein n=1 Tax=Capsella rubella TaxID=81985 RepID=R0I2X2_9BRAS|nr:EMBRYO SURROUNDING FACTOR 1.2 [Capsella rubella]EOA36579.1 hypothetical protein CARUB_v10011759mg [Capsella rubella]